MCVAGSENGRDSRDVTNSLRRRRFLHPCKPVFGPSTSETARRLLTDVWGWRNSCMVEKSKTFWTGAMVCVNENADGSSGVSVDNHEMPLGGIVVAADGPELSDGESADTVDRQPGRHCLSACAGSGIPGA